MSNETNFLRGTDEELEDYSSSVWISRTLFITIPLSLFQIGFGVANFYYYSNLFSYIIVFVGLASIVMSIIISKWAKQVFQFRLESSSLYRTEISQPLTTGLFISSLILAIAVLNLALNFFQRKIYILDHISALSSTSLDSANPFYGHNLADTQALHINILIIFTATNVLFCLYYLWTAVVSFKFVTFAHDAISELIFASGFFILVAAAGEYWFTHAATAEAQNPTLAYLVPEWALKAMGLQSKILMTFAFFIWLVNSREWRSCIFLFSFLFALIALGSIVLAGGGYMYSKDVYIFYTRNNAYSRVADRLLNIHELDLEHAGCPVKYLPPNNGCSSEFLVTRWESVDYEHYCLNDKCIGVMGEAYSKNYYLATEFAIFVFTCEVLLIIGGFYYVFRIKFTYEDGNSKRDWFWLLSMGIFMIAFALLFYKFGKDPHLIQEHTPFTVNQGKTVEQPDNTPDHDAGVDLLGELYIFKNFSDSSLRSGVANVLEHQNSTYALAAWDSTSKKFRQTATGRKEGTLTDLEKAFGTQDVQLAIYRDTSQDLVYGIFFNPSHVANDDTWIFRLVTSQLLDSGLPIYRISNKEELGREKVNNWIVGLRTANVSDWYSVSQNILSGITSVLDFKDQYSKFSWNNEAKNFQEDRLGTWKNSFTDFTSSFNSTERGIGLINFEFGNIRSTLGVLYQPNSGLNDTQVAKYWTDFAQNLEERGLPIFKTSNQADINYETLNNFTRKSEGIGNVEAH